ncbi:11205_t:CDS:2 [Entrophospora sp. SA101]|nr:5506_t:CDS:2 [Entrophospora sp. SA101]CAJ0905362.1 11205_t:CDS:2 [Entrophospora sp. SA101]
MSDIHVVVGIDFGTTYSGFAYSHKVNPDIETNQFWPPEASWNGAIDKFKINTVLMYDENGDKVKLWGYKALANKKTRRRINDSKDVGPIRPIELFKLHLGRDIETSENLESRLNEVSTQNRINYKKAVADYLSEMDIIQRRWDDLNFFENVLIVLSVPVVTKFIMRECVFKAGLINELHSENLQLITESEAAAIYCRKVLDEHFEVPFGKSFLIVDCGSGTVNLSVCRLLDDHSISLEEKTECSGDFCGGGFVDQEFAKFLGQKVGHHALKSFKENHYGRYQFMIHEFFHKEKHRFDGNESEFETIDFDLQDYTPLLIDYITDDLLKSRLEVDEWQITLEFHHMKSFFDPVINRIIGLINKQLENAKECSAMFLVGGFCESRYLQNVIKKEFHDRVKNISVPRHPMLAVVKGAVEYGLNMKCVKNRVLKNTYGVMLTVTRGTKVDVDEEFSVISTPLHPSSKTMSIEIFETLSRAPKFFDEPRMRQLEKIKVDLPENPNSNGASSSSSDNIQDNLDDDVDDKRCVEIILRFGETEIKAMAKVKGTGEIRQALINLGL